MGKFYDMTPKEIVAELDKYIREGVIENQEHKAIIDRKHEMNLFKLQLMPCYKPSEEYVKY